MSYPSIGNAARLATVNRDGRQLLVQHFDIARGEVHCWPNVVGYGLGTKKLLRFEETKPVVFRRDELTLKDLPAITLDIADTLFEQSRSTVLKTPLMNGSHRVKKTKSQATVLAAPNTARQHAGLRCPCHGVPVRFGRNKSGGEFWGCGTFYETGCRISYSADGSIRHDPDMVVGPKTVHLNAEAA